MKHQPKINNKSKKIGLGSPLGRSWAHLGPKIAPIRSAGKFRQPFWLSFGMQNRYKIALGAPLELPWTSFGHLFALLDASLNEIDDKIGAASNFHRFLTVFEGFSDTSNIEKHIKTIGF